MAGMDKQNVSAIAALARIEITDEEAAQMATECGAILGYVSELNQVTLEVDEPKVGEVFNVMREDGEPHEPGKFTADLVREMPKSKDNYLVVKKIL